jgi:hypothetical protein
MSFAVKVEVVIVLTPAAAVGDVNREESVEAVETSRSGQEPPSPSFIGKVG